MKIAAIHQPQYLPYLGFFEKVAAADVFVAMDSVQFQRRGTQNRNRIKSNEGALWLTVPVLQRSGQLIREVATNPTVEWQKQHWHALVVNYSRAPFFETYSTELKEILERPWATLCDLNMALLSWTFDALGISRQIVYMSDLDVAGRSSELLADICRAVDADHYISGPGGRRYMELDVFEAAGVEVMWQDFTSPTYTQLFPKLGFIPDLSVIDALFCCGPDVKAWLS